MSGRRGPPPRPAELRRLEAATGGSLRQPPPAARPASTPSPRWCSSGRAVRAASAATGPSRRVRAGALGRRHDRPARAWHPGERTLDLLLLESMAVHYARARRARDVIDAEGALSRGSTGQLVEHPAVRIEREATRLFHSLASDYALTPSSRTRLGLDLLLGARMQRSFETPADTDELGPNPRRLRGVDPA